MKQHSNENPVPSPVVQPDPLPFDPINFEIYCIIVPFQAGRHEIFQLLTEGIWKDSGEGDLWYRVDSARPEMHILRHIHIAHKKQTSAPRTQVSWNDTTTRHDAHNFDALFSPMDRARALAKRVLKLPDTAVLEAATLGEDVYGSYMLTEAAQTAGISYTNNNLFILRLP